LNWIETDNVWKKRCRLKVYQQPLMTIDESVGKELQKKKKKEKK
jgi:hypothetical protein